MINLVFTAALFNNNLKINLSANNIFDSYNFIDYRAYNNFEVGHEYWPDNTYINLDIIYYIFKGKYFYQVKNNIKNIINRL